MSADTSTRLLQLDGLLESKNRSIRFEAASAFGKFSIFDENAIKIIKKHLVSQSWDARVAAGKALHSILKNFNDITISGKSSSCVNTETESLRKLRSIKVLDVLNTYKPLLGDSEIPMVSGDVQNNNRRQRELVDQHLEYCEVTGMSSKKFLSDDEFVTNREEIPMQSSDNGQELASLIKKEENSSVADEKEEFSTEDRDKKFYNVLNEFIYQASDQRWFVRHGSAIAVCQIATTSMSRLSPELVDSCLFLFIHILILDKFNDFISGRNATAPVREQCAQAVVHILRHVDEVKREAVLQIVVQMMNTQGEQNWNVRQSGLLVMKYYFAIATNEKKRETFDRCFGLVIQSLNDTVDDVTGCAVKTLSSILSNDSISRSEMGVLVEKVMVHVWRLLLVESGKDQLRSGLDALVLDLLEIVELWLQWNIDESISRENLLVICSMLDVSFPQRCEKIVQLIDMNIERQNSEKLTAKDTFDIIKQFFRIIVFTPPNNTLSFLEKTFLTFQKLYRIYQGVLIESGMMIQTIGVWTGCLLYDHRNPMIDVFAHCIDGISSLRESPCERMCSEEMRFLSEKEKDVVYITRKILCAKFLAMILQSLYESDVEVGGQKVNVSIQLIFVSYFQSNSVMHNLGAALVVNEWGALFRAAINSRNFEKEPPMTIVHLANNILRGSNGVAKQYDEMSSSVNILTKECNEFIEYCSIRGFNKNEVDVNVAESIEDISKLAYNTARETLKTEKQKESMDTRFAMLIRSIESVKMIIRSNAIRITSLLSSALFYFGVAPEKLTPQIRPLVETMQLEENDAIASEIFRGAIPLLVLFSGSRTPRPCIKVLAKALDSFSSCDFRIPKPGQNCQNRENTIITLQRLCGYETDDSMEATTSEAAEKQTTPAAGISVQSKNAELIIMILCQFTVPQLPELYANFDLNEDIDQLTLLSRLELHECFWNRVGSRLSDESTEKIFSLLASEDPALRFAGAKAIETFTKSQCGDTMTRCYFRLVKMSENLGNVNERLGAIESFLRLSALDPSFLNGLATLFCPIVFRMLTDKNSTIRDAAGETFRRLIPLVTIENADYNIPDLCPELVAKRRDNQSFIHVLGSPSSLPRIKKEDIQGGFNGDLLREYQLEGITWLRFLRHYGLNGVLADDMGLGKTLQTMCAISLAVDNDTYDKKQRCSLIVCPRTLVDHWCLEWKRYFPKRERAQKTVQKSTNADICVVAYEDLKSNPLVLKKVWNYVVLDEGHVMRNTKTHIWRCANLLICRSRLILSGTPVQNSPADLWAIFSWLMPGYLGNEKQFRSQFLKKILKCRNPKANEADLKTGSLALSQLHRLILPFIMRRLKSDVLKELPDKCVQDYECKLSDEQKDVYRYLVDSCTSDGDALRAGVGISALHTLISLRKLVDHPILIYDTLQKLGAPRDILEKAQTCQSGKLDALGQLLSECRICSNQDSEETEDMVIVNSSEDQPSFHRALIFCQWKSSAKMVSRRLDSGEFGSRVPHLVLDGDVPAAERIKLVNRFNEDPSIDVLVLTTHIGGVGLNLTGADTVIFLDHDWNPMKDLQAIDRAHRLGQTRKVNVYRLITQGTIEEKVMSLAKFKLNTAQALISDDNSSLQSMQTNELMEMFALDGDDPKSQKRMEPVAKKPRKSSSITGPGDEWNLAEMWDETQYDDFQIGSFLKNTEK